MNEFKTPANYAPPYMPEFFVWWDTIEEPDVDLLEQQVMNGGNERVMQAFLEANPLFLIQHLGGGRGRWVLPQASLGNQYRTDFVVGNMHSYGYEWEAVELESPKARAFTKSGNFSHHLTHAVRQVVDWRTWLRRNQDYASRPRAEQGLGLTDIDANVPGLILIGRERDLDSSTNDRRRQLVQDSNIKIHTYDWLVRQARGRVEAIELVRKVGVIGSLFGPLKS